MEQKNDFSEVVYKPLVKPIPQEIKYSNSVQRTTWYLYMAAMTSNIAQMSFGFMLTWISPVTEYIFSADPNINPLGRPVTIFEFSLLGAAVPTGSVIGPLLIGKCFDIFGRRLSLTILCIIMTLALAVLAFSSSIDIYIAMLLLVGVCVGSMNVGFPLYISEITEDHNRGKLTCLIQIGVPLGIVISFVTGPYLSVRDFTLICASPVLLNTIFFLTILPETPIRLIKRKDIVGATKVLKKLRQKSNKEIEADINRIEFELEQTSNSKRGGCSQILTDKSSRNGLMMAAVTYNLLVLSGTPAINSYLQPIFSKADTSIPSNICALLVAIVQIFCYVGASFTVEKWGRRKLIFFSTITPIVPLYLIGLYFYLNEHDYTFVKTIDWFPVVMIMLFSALNNFGNASAPIALMNDLFTNQVKAVAVSSVLLISGILGALTNFGLPIIMEAVGVHWCFWIFASNSVVATIFVYFLVPETKGKTLLEIQDILRDLF